MSTIVKIWLKWDKRNGYWVGVGYERVEIGVG
jgi:hypothetical protein